MLLLVRSALALAAAAHVQIAIDDAGATKYAAQALSELVFLGPHLAVGAREEQGVLGRTPPFEMRSNENWSAWNKFFGEAVPGRVRFSLAAAPTIDQFLDWGVAGASANSCQPSAPTGKGARALGLRSATQRAAPRRVA